MPTPTREPNVFAGLASFLAVGLVAAGVSAIVIVAIHIFAP